MDKVNVLYCHKPDPETPLVVQAAALNYQYNRGRFTTVCTQICECHFTLEAPANSNIFP